MNSIEILPDNIINKIRSYVIFTPKNKEELINAVYLWCGNIKKAYKIYGHISLWNTIYITDMSSLFACEYSFNSVISSWDVSNVTDMREMFYDAHKFNQPLNNWDVSNVTNMLMMFQKATSFNQPLDNWDVSNVTDMRCMFNCGSFNHWNDIIVNDKKWSDIFD